MKISIEPLKRFYSFEFKEVCKSSITGVKFHRFNLDIDEIKGLYMQLQNIIEQENGSKVERDKEGAEKVCNITPADLSQKVK